MKSNIIKNIPFKINYEDFLKRIRLNKDHKEVDKVKSYIDKANDIAVPKAMYKEVYIDEIEDNHVVIQGVKFKSKIMSINLKDVYKVIIYIVTCGKEIEDWAEKQDGDMLEKYWLSELQETVLKEALKYIKEEIKTNLLPGSSSIMNPGSLIDWSITEQKKLFKLIGDPKNEIEVKLTDSSLMLPKKSVSGLIYPTEKNFENCQVCPREKCPSRSAPYNPSLLKEKYK